MKGKREKEKAVTNWDPFKCGGDGIGPEASQSGGGPVRVSVEGEEQS